MTYAEYKRFKNCLHYDASERFRQEDRPSKQVLDEQVPRCWCFKYKSIYETSYELSTRIEHINSHATSTGGRSSARWL